MQTQKDKKGIKTFSISYQKENKWPKNDTAKALGIRYFVLHQVCINQKDSIQNEDDLNNIPLFRIFVYVFDNRLCRNKQP